MSPANTTTRRPASPRRRSGGEGHAETTDARSGQRCPDTGRLMPECGCCACGRRLVARYAPHLAQP